MINIDDTPEEGDDITDKCFMLSVKMLGYDEDTLRVEGLINNERWFAVAWSNEEFMCNVSRSPMCRDDFWDWALKRRKTWFKAQTSVAPCGDPDKDMTNMVSIMANLVEQKRRTLKIKLLDA